MCSLNIFQVSLGGLFVFIYLCLLRQPFFFPEKLEIKKMMTFLPVCFSWVISCIEPENLRYWHPFQNVFLSSASYETIQSNFAQGLPFLLC